MGARQKCAEERGVRRRALPGLFPFAPGILGYGSIKELLVKARGEIAASPPIRKVTVPFYESAPINRPASRGLVLSRTVSSNTVSEVIRARTKIAAEGRGSVKGTVTIARALTQTTNKSYMLPKT